MESVAVTRFACGSIFVTVPSPVLGTQTAPCPTEAMAGRWPSAITARAGPEGAVEADGVTPDPGGAQPASGMTIRRAAMGRGRPSASVNIDLGHEGAGDGGGGLPLVHA